MPEDVKAEKIGVSALCRVSTKGGAGTYLYIPRLFAETYSLISGDVVEVYFRKVFKRVYVEENEKSRVIDLSKERGRKKRRPSDEKRGE